MKLLLVEDDRNMSRAVSELLRQEHYIVDVVSEGGEAEDYILSDDYDAVILDVMLPDRNGYEITKSVRRAGNRTPILFLTAKSATADKVEGLDSGGDDYLTKPFETDELLARVRSLLRRKSQDIQDVNTLSYLDLLLDRKTATLVCTRSGISISLSEKEYHILELFFQNPGQILSKEQFAVRIWGYENEAEYNKVEVYISFTRKKLAFVESAAQIKVVRGLGYRLRTLDDD
jgi:DNA-binding response OmpR family regulator